VLLDYEVTYILRPSLDDEKAEEMSGTIADTVRTLGGEVVSVDRMGRRRLAYEIADVREGYYVSMRFRADAAQSKELQRLLRLNENVLRELLIRLEPEDLLQPSIPVPVAVALGEDGRDRDGRDGRDGRDRDGRDGR
jgi:small subunit ribosomal protein S6